MEKKRRMGRKGMAEYLTLAGAFAIGVVGFVIVVIIMQGLLASTDVSCRSGYTANATGGNCYLNTNNSVKDPFTYGGNVTQSGLVFSQNFSNQWGLAGTILGYVLILGILALVGVGGYMGYQKFKGSR